MKTFNLVEFIPTKGPQSPVLIHNEEQFKYHFGNKNAFNTYISTNKAFNHPKNRYPRGHQ